MTRDEALDAIRAERDRQTRLWAAPHAHGQGDCSSVSVPLMVKVAVLAEECGEVARAALDGDPEQMATELVQVAAVALAILEGEPGCTCYLGREIPGTDTTPVAGCVVHRDWPSADQLAEMPMHDQEAWERRCAAAETKIGGTA